MAERNCKCSGDNEGRGLKPDAALIGAIVRGVLSSFFILSQSVPLTENYI